MQPYGNQMPNQVPKKHARSYGAKTGLTYAIGYLVVIWAVFFVDEIFFFGNLKAFGIHPLDPAGLPNIFTSPLLHANLEHLISNSIPGAIFCFIIGFSGHRVFWEVTGIVTVVGGAGVWLFGGIGTNHIGASGLVYGWLFYLVVRGIFNRSFRQILLGVVLGFAYSGLVWGMLPGTPGVSWQAHLFGAVGGVLAGMIITSDDPPALQAKRRARQARR
ncbi:rhomboid family intramembrane serine protease [Corynebacterium lubricantis]|uniref:rhomboid family intramembrane serine protease n=1 Tax=Corynebacterium lubricantis TaxID=541095 RepID=UPI0003648687